MMFQKIRKIQNLKRSLFLLILIFFLSGCSSINNWFSSPHTAMNNENMLPEKNFKELLTTDKPVYGDAEKQYRLARHFQKQGRHEIAIEEFIKVLKINPEYYNAYNALGVSYDLLKKFDLARDSYEAALKLNPTLDYVHNNLGYSHLLKGDLQEAALAFEKAIVLNDQKITYKKNLSLVMAKLGSEYQAKADTLPLEESISNTETEIKANGKTRPEQQTWVRDISSEEKIVEETIAQTKPERIYYAVQLGVYIDINNARNALKRANQKGLDCPYITRVEREKPFHTYYRIRFGKFTRKRTADSIASRIIDNNGDTAFTVTENYPIDVYHADPEKNCADMAIKHPVLNKISGIEISNGNGVNKMAGKVGRYLFNKGYSVKRISNAAHFNHPRTTIYYYPGFYDKAQQLIEQIPGLNKGLLVESNRINHNIKVIIGKDIIPYKKQFASKNNHS